MTTSHRALILNAVAPPLVGDDSRPLAVVCAMERGLPGLRLAWTITAEGFTPAPEGEARVIARTGNGGFALYSNGNREHLVTITGREIPSALCPGGKPQFFVYAKWPTDAVGRAAAADVLEGIAESARAYWAHVTSIDVLREVEDQRSDSPRGPQTTPRGLPMIKRPWDIRSPDAPGLLGWVNYWSPGAARAIGFPDPERDAELLSRSRRTESGGWVVRLTEAPLDLDNPAHLNELLRVYERFPVIGGRAAPLE